MAVLYRKYRPQAFADVIGQEAIVQTLQNAVASGKPAHAYVFTGSRGVGKTSLARILAKALNCEKSKKGEACLTCPNCTAIAQGNFFDLVEIDAASNTGVDNIRELIEHAQFSPTKGKMKVFIIDEVHMLSRGAFNALLKTLEEPPSHALFILATTEIHKVPATIISRAQRFDFQRVSEARIEKHLHDILSREHASLDPAIVRLLALRAEGSLRDALSLMDKVLSLGATVSVVEAQKLLGVTPLQISQELLGHIVQGATSLIPGFFSQLLEDGVDFMVLSRDFLEYLRKLLVYKVSEVVDPLLSDSEVVLLRSQAQSTSAPEIMYIMRLFLRAHKDFAVAPSPELPLLLASVEAALHSTPATLPAHAGKAPVKSVVVEAPEAPPVTTFETVESTRVQKKTDRDISVTTEELHEYWTDIVEKIRGINSPLATLVKNSPMLGVEEGVVVLSVKYLFHKEHLESAKNISLITQVMSEVSGKQLGLRAELQKRQVAETLPDHGAALADALKVFGGELVE